MLFALRQNQLKLQRSKQIARGAGILFVVVESYRPPRGFVLNQMALGATARAATMSGQPSPSKSAKAKPYTVTTRKYVDPTPPTMKDAFQKKVRNERRDRRAARKRVAKTVTRPSIGQPQATDTVQ
jgi:hypothetical protein